jgi:hypothetical protein
MIATTCPVLIQSSSCNHILSLPVAVAELAPVILPHLELDSMHGSKIHLGGISTSNGGMHNVQSNAR